MKTNFKSRFSSLNFSRGQLLVFAVVFAGIGGLFIYKSFAAGPPTGYYWKGDFASCNQDFSAFDNHETWLNQRINDPYFGSNVVPTAVVNKQSSVYPWSNCSARLIISNYLANGSKFPSGSVSGGTINLWEPNPYSAPWWQNGHTTWSRFSVLLPDGTDPNYPGKIKPVSGDAVDNDFHVIAEWHKNDGAGAPGPTSTKLELGSSYGGTLVFKPTGGNSSGTSGYYIFETDRTQTKANSLNPLGTPQPLKYNHWYDLVFKWVLSPNPSVGYLEWYVDGNLRFADNLATMFQKSDGSVPGLSFQAGMYRSYPFYGGRATDTPDYNEHIYIGPMIVGPTKESIGFGSTTPPPPSSPTVSLSANPYSIPSGSSSTLTWSSTNATSCTSSGAWTGSKNTSGTQVISPTSTSVYNLSCTGAGGTANASATVTVSSAPPLPPPPTGGTFISDMAYQTVANGWGPIEKDKSNGEQAAGDGRTITLNGVAHAKGLGTHANSEVNVALNGQYASFLADVGLDDEVDACLGGVGSAVFQVFADGVKLYDSGAMNTTSAVKQINTNVAGKNQLKLIVTDSGNGVDCDHADWASARLTASSTPPQPPPDTTAPSVSITAPASGASVSGTVNVTANASDPAGTGSTASGVSKVEFFVDGTLRGIDSTAPSPYTYSWNTASLPNGTHSIIAKAYDSAGNSSSHQINVNVANADTTPPSTPTNLSAAASAYNKVNLSWTASTDNVGVAGYYIVRNGTTIATTTGTGTTYTDNNVSGSSTYTYQVIAYDAKGNNSTASATKSVTTPSAPDTIAPSTPTNLTATAVSTSQINLSFRVSTDNVGVASYDVYRATAGQSATKIATITHPAGSTSSTTITYGSTGLAASTAYNYYVVAKDAANNSSVPSLTVTATTQAPPPPPPAPTTGYGNLAGTVTSSSGDRLRRAYITISTGKHTRYYASRSDGSYLISKLPAGNYSPVYWSWFYTPQTKQTTITSNKTTTLNVVLESNR